MHMLLMEFFIWWYGPGWKQAWRECFGWMKGILLTFSLDVLLKTLFSPWKRIITPPGRGLDAKMRAMMDNLVSRVIGFFVRIIVLIAALVMVVITGVVGVIVAVVWPLMPFAGVALIIWGVAG